MLQSEQPDDLLQRAMSWALTFAVMLAVGAVLLLLMLVATSPYETYREAVPVTAPAYK